MSASLYIDFNSFLSVMHCTVHICLLLFQFQVVSRSCRCENQTLCAAKSHVCGFLHGKEMREELILQIYV
jgi:hypothetical protein